MLLLKEDEIRDYIKKNGTDSINWEFTSSCAGMSEDFIREFKYNVHWDLISAYQKLSEDFISEFKDMVNWSYVSAYQKLSEDFIREFKDKVYWNNSLSNELLLECKKYIKRFIHNSADFFIFMTSTTENYWVYSLYKNGIIDQDTKIDDFLDSTINVEKINKYVFL